MRKATVIGVMVLAGTLASPAFADEYTGFRLGLSAGQETLKSDVAFLGFGTDKIDSSRFGFTVFGGWALNKWFAVEAAYSGGSDFNQDLYIDEDNFPARNIASHYDIQAFIGSAVGSWWVTPKFGLFGRVGVYGWKGTATISYDDNVNTNPPGFQTVEYDDDGFEPLIGLGVQTELDGGIIRLEYTMTELDDHAAPGIAFADTKINTLNLGIVWTLR